jgi:membrane protease YdiL (CAAX protease family)
MVWIAGSVVAPFTEELFFRGLIFGSYYQIKGPPIAYVVSATLFSFLHLNLPALLPILVLGLMLSWLYRTTGSITPCVIAHGCNNGLTLMVLYLLPSQAIAGN